MRRSRGLAAVVTAGALAAGALMAVQPGGINVYVGPDVIPTATATATATATPSPTPTATPTPGAANLWIDTTGGTCTRQATAGSYSDAGACSTLAGAMTAASTGDTILVKAGTYPGEQLTGTKTLTIAGETGSRPSFGQIITEASSTTFRNLRVENRDRPNWTGAICPFWDFTFYVCGPDVTIDDVIIDGLNKGKADGDSNRLGGLEVTDTADRLVFKNSEIKGIRDNQAWKGGADDILIEHNEIHDMHLTTAGAAADVHLECIANIEGNRQVWRGNRFYDCATTDWQASNWVGGSAYGPVTFENNVFGCAILNENPAVFQNGAPTLMVVGGNAGNNSVAGWVVRGNTFECPGNIGTPSTADDNHSGVWKNNLGWDPGCGAAEWTMSYNVGAVCSSSTGSVVVANATNTPGSPTQAPFYVNEAPPTYDFHLLSGTAAINAGNPTGVFATDRDGVARSLTTPDVGAYELVP